MQSSTDDFALLGLPPDLNLDAELLRQAWLERIAQCHPDRAGALCGTDMAERSAARLNQAYQRLREPLERARLLCERLCTQPNEAQLPAEFLLMQMNWHERQDAGEAGLDSVLQEHWQRQWQHLGTALLQGQCTAAWGALSALRFLRRLRAAPAK